VDEYNLVHVNFKNLVHKGEMITNKSYVLTSQVDQIYYVEDERDPNWACAVSTKPNNIYDIGQGEWPHDTCSNYHECEPLLLASNNDHDP
jgi:hypothetical protein